MPCRFDRARVDRQAWDRAAVADLEVIAGTETLSWSPSPSTASEMMAVFDVPSVTSAMRNSAIRNEDSVVVFRAGRDIDDGARKTSGIVAAIGAIACPAVTRGALRVARHAQRSTSEGQRQRANFAPVTRGSLMLAGSA